MMTWKRTEKTLFWFQLSSIQIVRQVIRLNHLNTGHPHYPVFRFDFLILVQTKRYVVCCGKLNNTPFLFGVFIWDKLVYVQVTTNCQYSSAPRKNARLLNRRTFFDVIMSPKWAHKRCIIFSWLVIQRDNT